MDMNEFNNLDENKFLIVLGKMYASVFGQIEKHVKTFDLNTTEFLILYAIAANGALTIQDIGGRIDMTSGNMTYTVDKLEKRDLIKRIRCPEDRRKIFIDFTDAGNKMWTETIINHAAYLQKAFSSIDKDLLLQTVDAMKIIGRNIKTDL